VPFHNLGRHSHQVTQRCPLTNVIQAANDFRHAEIGYLVLLVVLQDIFGLEIAVNDIMFVHFLHKGQKYCETNHNLLQDADGFLLGDFPTPLDLAK
jgi:hypothetical protein